MSGRQGCFCLIWGAEGLGTDLDVERSQWFEGSHVAAYHLDMDFLRQDSGHGRGILGLRQNPVVEPRLNPQPLACHRPEYFVDLHKTVREWDLMRQLQNTQTPRNEPVEKVCRSPVSIR